MILAIMIFYLILMLSIGVYFYRKNQNMSDYILGGRKLNPWMTSLSAQASDMSGWLLTGLPGLAFISIIGTVEAVWTSLGLLIGTYLNWLFVAKRLRLYSQISGNSITLPDYFSNRFKQHGNILRVVSAFFILVFFLIYTAAQFKTGAFLLCGILPDLSYNAGLIISALVIITYTFLGGFMAVCLTDVIQGCIMFVAITLLPLIGALAVLNSAQAPEFLSSMNFRSFFIGDNFHTVGAITVISALGWGLGYFGQPHILPRFMAIRSASEVKFARRIAMSWVTLALCGAVMVGVVGRYMNFDTSFNNEQVFIMMVQYLLPSFFAGIFLAAVMAASMSTADSQLLVGSSAFSNDLCKVIFKKEKTDRTLLWIGRFAVIAMSLAAMYLALDPNNSIFKLVSYAWGGFGSAFGPCILLSLYWKRMTAKGACCGIFTGGLVSLVWMNMSGGIFQIYEIVPGFIISTIVIFVVSLLDKKPSKEVYSEFNEMLTCKEMK